MAVVIQNNNLENHSVDKYNFKVLSQGTSSSDSALVSDSSLVEEEMKYTQNDNPGVRESDIDSSSLSVNSKDSLIESLMKKTDDMSSNFIKLQMKIEAKEEEYASELQKVKEASFAEGLVAGLKQAKEKQNKDMADGLDQFSSSVLTLETSAKEFELGLENIKSELMSAALDIAKEVINIELGTNSQAIATTLSEELIKELQSASKVTLKVNPKDHGAVSEKIGSLEHIEIISDSAVNEGGVIAISDAGNIDAQISKRFQRVKRAALSEE